MPASYPGAIKSFSAVVNGVTKLIASLFNSPYDEITAIETELGVDVAGSMSDLVARLTVFLNDDGTAKTNIQDYGTLASSSTSKTLELIIICFGTLTIAAGSQSNITNLPYASASSYTAVAILNSDTSAAVAAKKVSGSTLTLKNGDSAQQPVNWVTIGT